MIRSSLLALFVCSWVASRALAADTLGTPQTPGTLGTPQTAGTLTLPLVQDEVTKLTSSVPQPAAELESEFKQPVGGLTKLLADLTPGIPLTHGPVTIVPLLARNPAPPALPMVAAGPDPAPHAQDTAAAWQLVSRPTSGLELALLGQILQGPDTQDRVMERSRLVPTGTPTRIVAYCCEHLFEAQVGKPLHMTSYLVPGSVRARLVTGFHADAALTATYREVNRHFGDVQDFTWSEIGKRLKDRGIPSKFEACLDLVPHRAAEVARLAATPLPPQTAGFAIGVGDKLVALECFGSPALFQPHAPELITSWLDHRGSAPAADPAGIIGQATALLAAPPPCEAVVADGGGVVTLVLGGAFPGLATSVRGQTLHALLVPR